MKREPVCVLGERVWRTYLGGREIGKIHGDEKAEDSHFPEEWMYSVTMLGGKRLWKVFVKLQGENMMKKH